MSNDLKCNDLQCADAQAPEANPTESPANNFQVQKSLSTEVQALMADWREITGRFYLSQHAEHHYGRETLLDVLNAEGKAFVPFAQGDDTPLVLIQKSRIVGLKPSEPGCDDWPHVDSSDPACWKPARMAFAGFELTGKAYTGDMEPHRRRLADLLNLGPAFFVFETEDDPWIVNRDLLNHLVPLD